MVPWQNYLSGICPTSGDKSRLLSHLSSSISTLFSICPISLSTNKCKGGGGREREREGGRGVKLGRGVRKEEKEAGNRDGSREGSDEMRGSRGRRRGRENSENKKGMEERRNE